VFVILFALGCERKLTVQESDKAPLLRVGDLVPYGFNFENIERYETFTKTKSIEGSYDIDYEFDVPDTEDKRLFLHVTVSVARKKSDARINEGAESIALRYALKAKGIEEEEIPNFYRYGDASSFYLLKKEGKSVGNYFTVREGNKTYSLIMSGMYFDDPALWKELIEPKLKLFSAYKPT
jgi:hypothetical protein